MFLGVHLEGNGEYIRYGSNLLNVSTYVKKKQRTESPREEKGNRHITNGPYEDKVPHKATSKFEIHVP